MIDLNFGFHRLQLAILWAFQPVDLSFVTVLLFTPIPESQSSQKLKLEHDHMWPTEILRKLEGYLKPIWRIL